jgi:DNA-binding Xre family transcriptional regulator
MATKKTKKKTEKKNVVVVEELTLYKTFADEVSEVHYSLFNLKDDVFIGEVSNKELVERLFKLCHALDKALDIVEVVHHNDSDDDDDDWYITSG